VRPIHLRAIGYVHGAPRSLAELDDPLALELMRPANGLAHFRASDLEIWQLAATAAERTLARSPGAAPDLLIYVSENDTDVTTSLARIADRLRVPRAHYLAVSGHDCGNLGPAMQVAVDALAAGRHDEVLLVLADRVLRGSRLMRSRMSIFSDGAAACLLTSEATPGPHLVLHALATKTLVEVGPDVAPEQSMLATAHLATDAVADVLGATGRPAAAFDRVILPNYRISSQMFLLAAMRFPTDRLLVGPVADFGHCFSADLLITLDRYPDDGSLKPGDWVIAAATGPHSWSVFAVECA
jgi:3-oxoacyl-[acyl-carrier-protein] synthase III